MSELVHETQRLTLIGLVCFCLYVILFLRPPSLRKWARDHQFTLGLAGIWALGIPFAQVFDDAFKGPGLYAEWIYPALVLTTVAAIPYYLWLATLSSLESTASRKWLWITALLAFPMHPAGLILHRLWMGASPFWMINSGGVFAILLAITAHYAFKNGFARAKIVLLSAVGATLTQTVFMNAQGELDARIPAPEIFLLPFFLGWVTARLDGLGSPSRRPKNGRSHKK